jgi:hypothetical protein
VLVRLADECTWKPGDSLDDLRCIVIEGNHRKAVMDELQYSTIWVSS